MKFASKIYRQFVFTHEFFRFLMVDRVRIKKDNIILITGRRGQGKTTVALKLILGFNDLDKIQEYYNKEINAGKEEKDKVKHKLDKFTSFNMHEDMAFEKKALQDLCRETRMGFILADEAVTAVARRNAMTRSNKLLHEILTINRKNFNTIFFCLPSVEDFDVSILQYITCWIHVDGRGLACVMMPLAQSLFGRKSWDVDKMKKIYDKFIEDNPRTTNVPYWLFDNFRGYIKFSKLSKAIEEKYIKIAHEKKNRDSENNGEEKTIKKPRLDDVKTTLLKELATQIIEGKIKNPEEYYKYCGELEFKKDRLNREMNELLAQLGDGRTAIKAIRDNHAKAESKEEIFKNTRFKL